MGFMGRDQGYLLWGECPLYGRSILLILPSCNGLLPPHWVPPIYRSMLPTPPEWTPSIITWLPLPVAYYAVRYQPLRKLTPLIRQPPQWETLISPHKTHFREILSRKSYSDHLIIGQLSPLKMKIFRPCPNFQSFHLLSDSGDIEKHAV